MINGKMPWDGTRQPKRLEKPRSITCAQASFPSGIRLSKNFSDRDRSDDPGFQPSVIITDASGKYQFSARHPEPAFYCGRSEFQSFFGESVDDWNPVPSKKRKKAGLLSDGISGFYEPLLIVLLAKKMAVLPHARATLTFLPREQGGREHVPSLETLRSYKYRPHIVLGDPDFRETRDDILNNVQVIHEGDGEYLGIAFRDADSEPKAGIELNAEFAFMYYPQVTYRDAIPGAAFTLREGARVVGFGTIREVTDKETIKANKAEMATPRKPSDQF